MDNATIAHSASATPIVVIGMSYESRLRPNVPVPMRLPLCPQSGNAVILGAVPQLEFRTGINAALVKA